MNAQQSWKSIYRMWRDDEWPVKVDRNLRECLYAVAEEAALERIIERQQREIERLQHERVEMLHDF